MGDKKENLHEEVITVKFKSGDSDNNEPLPELEKLPAKVKYIKPKQTKNGVRANFCFELLGDFEGRRAWGSVPYWQEPNQDTDLYKWLSNILGKPIEDEVSFKLGNLIGKEVLIVIENSEKVDEDGNPYQNVIKVLKSDNTSTKKKTTKKEKEEEEDLDDVLEEQSIEDESDNGDEEKEEKKETKNTSESSDDIDEDDLPF